MTAALTDNRTCDVLYAQRLESIYGGGLGREVMDALARERAARERLATELGDAERERAHGWELFCGCLWPAASPGSCRGAATAGTWLRKQRRVQRKGTCLS